MYLIPEQWRLGLAGGKLLFRITESRLSRYIGYAPGVIWFGRSCGSL